MSEYKTYKKEKRMYFVLSIAAFFLPIIITTVCLLPIVIASNGIKIAVGLAVIFLNSLVFLCGLFRNFTAHFPMLNIPAFVFLFLREFFTLLIFDNFADSLSWIELAAAIGSIASCILWSKYLKYKDYAKTMKAAIGSGAFITKGEKND